MSTRIADAPATWLGSYRVAFTPNGHAAAVIVCFKGVVYAAKSAAEAEAAMRWMASRTGELIQDFKWEGP